MKNREDASFPNARRNRLAVSDRDMFSAVETMAAMSRTGSSLEHHVDPPTRLIFRFRSGRNILAQMKQRATPFPHMTDILLAHRTVRHVDRWDTPPGGMGTLTRPTAHSIRNLRHYKRLHKEQN